MLRREQNSWIEREVLYIDTELTKGIANYLTQVL